MASHIAAGEPAAGGDTRGFTLIELLVVLAIVALLMSIALPRYFQHIDASKAVVLRENLQTTRDAIDKFYGDQGRYPETLDELVTRKYLRALPIDPVTGSNSTWKLAAPDDGAKGNVYDLKSGADGVSKDGVPYSDM
jgi:general secretion pathway protein G